MSHDEPYRPRRAAADLPDDEPVEEGTSPDSVDRDDPDATLIINPRRAAALADDRDDEPDQDDEPEAGKPEQDDEPEAVPAASTPPAPAPASTPSPWSRAAALLRRQDDAPVGEDPEPSGDDSEAPNEAAHQGKAADQGRPADQAEDAAPADEPRSPASPGEAREHDGHRTGGRRMPVVAASIVTVLAVILGLGYVSVSFLGNGQPVVPFGSASNPPPSSARPSTPPVSVDRLLTPEQVQHLNTKAAWDVARTQEGRDDQSPVAACLSRPDADDIVSETSALRTLTTSSGPSMSLLHDSSLYADSDQAGEALTVIARELGGCTTSGAYLSRAQNVEGLGNQALAVQVRVNPAAQDADPQYHTVLAVRTGRVVNVVDVVAETKFVPSTAVAETLIPILNQQCAAAGGYCAQSPRVSTVVPPIGNETPGLPVLADIPALPNMTGRWSASDPTENPDPMPEFSGCERFTSSKAKLNGTVHRAYLVQDDDAIPATYGWDLMMFTAADADQAKTLVKDVTSSINGCEDRQRTAEVSDSETFTGTGTQKIAITATTWTIRQQTGEDDDSFIDYRVALVRADNKVAYIFLPLVAGDVDFTGDDWEALAIRVGQRATQVK